MRAALPEDDVPRNDQLERGFLRAETLAGALGGFVRATFGDVGGGPGEDERSEKAATGRREGEDGADMTRGHYGGGSSEM